MSRSLRRLVPLFLSLPLFFMMLSVRLYAVLPEGRCVGVSDGDTVTLLIDGRVEKVRLFGIDAPEKGQAFGQRAKLHAASLVYGRRVGIERKGVDRYGRTIGRLFVDGRSVNEAMLRAGFAWHYTRYSSDSRLDSLERDARKGKRGLWADREPLSPWEYRMLQRGGFPQAGRQGAIPEKTGGIRSEASSAPYRGNARNRVFHRKGCQAYDCLNCTIEFSGRDEAIRAGYRPCGQCNP
jgi:micrococcal nuclease